MSATSTSTAKAPPTSTQSGTTILAGVTRSATPKPTGSLAPTNNVHSPSTNITVSQGTTIAPNQTPLAQPVPAEPSIPLLPLASSTQCSAVPTTRRKSKKLSHLSHISAATWIGVGLALGALVVAVYYGEPMWRLARWTALNDFRASCISDHDHGLQESARCKALLATPARPPPVVKRTVYEADDTFRMTALRWTENIVIFVVTSIVFLVWLKGYTEEKHYVEHSMVKLDVSRIHKLGMGTEQICVIIPAGEPDPAQELEEWDSADDNDYNFTQTGAGSGDAASEIDSDDDQTRFPAVKLFEGRNGTDAGSEVDSVSTFEVRNGPDAGSEVDSGSLPCWPFGADDADDLPNEQNGTDAASEVNSDKRLTRFPVKSTKERDRTNAAPEVDSVPSHASDQEADKPSTVSTLYDRRANWIQTARVEDEPFEFDGPISALKFSNSIGTRDLRASHKNELDLRAVKIPIQRGVTTLRLMASDMLTITERYARHGVENHVVWEGTLNASERLLKRLSLRGRRYIYLILDPQFVKKACPPLPEPEIEFEFPKRKLGLNTIWEGDEEEEKKEDDVN